MTDKPEITRNDQTAIAFLKKIVDRLDADRAAYEARIAQFHATLSSFNTVYSHPNLTSAQANMASVQLQAIALQQTQLTQVAAQYGNHSHTVSTPGHSHGIGITVPQWEPYLTQAEYDTLRAWADGEDILLHILSAER
ncbi:hypothetical protein [Rhizobium mongolense]|uniref:Uncharacterized protein n=2 Tax=Rhizobium mongolense TaxID=57676 RepID=A0ABR6IQH7_9HYPH|nr:hypothetical protein [Rhizobium mongolense]MBB4230065.1 hypothetical protein [Rhizobium mongolense]TVZ72804.1 hypothetical protein BCL32_0991 [Rhizobium mongolense USDA 1844]